MGGGGGGGGLIFLSLLSMIGIKEGKFIDLFQNAKNIHLDSSSALEQLQTPLSIFPMVISV